MVTHEMKCFFNFKANWKSNPHQMTSQYLTLFHVICVKNQRYRKEFYIIMIKFQQNTLKLSFSSKATFPLLLNFDCIPGLHRTIKSTSVFSSSSFAKVLYRQNAIYILYTA